jgi:hypothetical protein
VTSQDGLGDRYGAAAPWRRWSVIVASAVVGLAFLGWLGWTTWVHATPDVESKLVTFEVQDEHTVTTEVDVRLKDDHVRASCLVRAFAEDHTVVGELSFVPEYDVAQPIELSVRTERRATSVELVGCTAPGEPRPS